MLAKVGLYMAVLLLLWCSIVARGANTSPPNIVWIWFDDMGIADMSFMGGDIPTPILDDLALGKSVKLNFHYTEAMCSVSRSAFLTGRYAFKSGVNTVIRHWQSLGFNERNNVLFSKIFEAKNFNNFIAGKWHAGHDRDARLPYRNGFGAGVYDRFRGIGDYYPADATIALQTLDDNCGPMPNGTVKDERDAILNGTLSYHPTYRIGKHQDGATYEYAVELDPLVYIEDTYVAAIEAFLAAQNDSAQPFFLYYSLKTPQIPLEAPPSTRNGEDVDYSLCTDLFASSTGTCAADAVCLYCSQIHYASLGIKDIVDSIQTHPSIDWSNTLIVITSDNGPTLPGSAMPLRGMKASVFEGGIREPAFMFGGIIEAFTTTLCQYNEMVHVSDWFHIFMNLIGVAPDDVLYNPDADHSGLSIWENIKCQCSASDSETLELCNTDYPPRTELITMVKCGEGSASFMHSTAIIRDGYKLVVNGREGIRWICPDTLSFTPSEFSVYYAPPDLVYSTPNNGFYEDVYQVIRERLGPDEFDTVFRSKCLDDLYAFDNATLDNASYPPFQYGEYLLFNLAEDYVEACALDLSDPLNAAKKEELLLALEAASVEYDSPNAAVDVIDCKAVQATLQGYDCRQHDSNAVYLSLWGDTSISNLTSYQEVWQGYITEYEECIDDSESSGYLLSILNFSFFFPYFFFSF